MDDAISVGLDTNPEVAQELITAWTPEDFKLEVLAGSELRVDHEGNLSVALTALLVPTVTEINGNGLIERYVDLGTGAVRHAKLELPEAAQRQERGRQMLGASVEVYEQLGLEKIALQAIAIGRYVWAMCGFGFRSATDRELMATHIRGLISEKGIPLSDLDWDTYEPFDIAYSESAEPLSLREWLQLLDETTDDSDEDLDELVTSPGKLLLLSGQSPSWSGSLRIGSRAHQSVGYGLMAAYTGLDHD